MKATSPRGGSHETILLVDDDPAIRRAATRVLELHGYDVLSAATGDEALRTLAEHPERVDLLLTDLEMPGLDGRELARRAGEAQPNLRVLFTSGRPQPVAEPSRRANGETAFIVKPYGISELARRVREVLDTEPPAH